MAAGEKTEAPTPRRREEARSEGNVPKSVELNSVLALLAGIMVLKYAGAGTVTQMLDLMGNSFRNLPTDDWTIASVTTFGREMGVLYLKAMAPLFAAIAVVGVGGNFLQSGLMLTAKPLTPDFSRLNPVKGFQRLFSQRAAAEFVKSVIKLAIIGYIVYQALQDKYIQMVTLSGSDIRGAAGAVVDVAAEVLLKATLALLAVAGLDYGFQRWQYERSIRMTKEELKEELRQSEGDPQIRAKIRQQQKQMAARRMMQDVPAADVVLTNPTHLAVALQYKPESMRSPKVVAKGQLLIAERIKDVARQHGVPVIENKPLAQALFHTVEIGAEIPPMLYRAVAEVLAFIYSLKRERRLGGYRVGV
ncbi:MAG: flagellar biosynthesis protein FlhB [Bacteroidetes bacterium]|nr:flagellar biosynthesis protein FlhB [Bacteroidota bacterium]MCL5027294.1 flagellar biosynthesis protein FlhB [Chloroflexota bacterium]